MLSEDEKLKIKKLNQLCRKLSNKVWELADKSNNWKELAMLGVTTHAVRRYWKENKSSGITLSEAREFVANWIKEQNLQVAVPETEKSDDFGEGIL